MTKAEAHRALLINLQRYMQERPQRNDGRPPRWISYEREQMLLETNRLRAELGKEPVEQEQIVHAEELALGLSDYASKYALYCAELVIDLA